MACDSSDNHDHDSGASVVPTCIMCLRETPVDGRLVCARCIRGVDPVMLEAIETKYRTVLQRFGRR